MNTGFIFHIPEELLEQFALGKVPEPHCAPLDEHLLICPACQNSLAEIDEYIRVMRAALAAPLPKLSPSFACRCV